MYAISPVIYLWPNKNDSNLHNKWFQFHNKLFSKFDFSFKFPHVMKINQTCKSFINGYSWTVPLLYQENLILVWRKSIKVCTERRWHKDPLDNWTVKKKLFCSLNFLSGLFWTLNFISEHFDPSIFVLDYLTVITVFRSTWKTKTIQWSRHQSFLFRCDWTPKKVNLAIKF